MVHIYEDLEMNIPRFPEKLGKSKNALYEAKRSAVMNIHPEHSMGNLLIEFMMIMKDYAI